MKKILIAVLLLGVLFVGGCGMQAAKDGDTVKINYRGTLSDGTEFDSSAGKPPLEFTLGQGQVIPGFEKGVLGMKVGEKKTITIAAKEAYGEVDPRYLQDVPRSIIPANISIAKDKYLMMTVRGEPVRARVADLNDTTVTLDLNHPLAGKDLTFDIELVEIVKEADTQASEEE